MLLDFINLKNGSGAMYYRLYSQINAAVLNGSVKKGERLPSIREAAAQLNISRTTVENAYLKLCIEGVAESSPQRGYFICGTARQTKKSEEVPKRENKILYDFSGRSIDSSAADISFWKKTVREVLRNTEELISYGDPQGESGLRSALASYSYKARGVRTSPENIVIGAGIGPLLNILCGLIGTDNTVGLENGGFEQARLIFSDYGISSVALQSDKNGAKTEALKKSGANILMLLPSALSKISVTGLSARRSSFVKWVGEEKNRLIIEDDYNGELRYTARSVTAFQGKCSDSTVYIGSFSKLLLPSVRIAYMVLPDSLVPKFYERRGIYNQTCGKTEQIALKEYIETGELEKHLRRLRKLYYAKSKHLCRAVKEIIPSAEITLYESSLTAELDLKINTESADICAAAEKNGLKLLPGKERGCVRLCFAGIADSDIPPAVKLLKNILLSFSD
ncbi:MAG: PLP-dependent aminotransferase family protein [Acutalibacteraceae bacterium]|nr:PLP-dependent aminotransferase family protein [Acutalibacteraceae bacterium]